MRYNTMFALPYFGVILFTISQVSFGQFAYPPTSGFEKNAGFGFITPGTLPSPDPNCKPVVIPQYNPASANMFANVPSVTLFINKFLKTVDSTDILREVYDLSKTPAKQYGLFNRQEAEKVLSKLGLQNAAAIAEFSSRAILLYFDVLTLPVVASHFANSAANVLFVFGALDLNNAEYLASEFAQSVIRCAKVHMNPADPTSKFEPVMHGYSDFLKSQGLLTKEKAPIIAFYSGNDYFLQAANNRLV